MSSQASHRVDAHQQPAQGERFEQFRDCGDLVALVGHLLLPEHKPQFGGVGADHVQWRVVGAARSAYALAVDGDRAIQRGHQIADPAPEHAFEMLGVEHAEQPFEGVGRRHAVAQGQKAAQPRLMFLPPFGDLGDGVAVGEHGCNGHDQHFAHVVSGAVARAPWVFDVVQAFHEASRRLGSHPVGPKNESRRRFAKVHKGLHQAIDGKRDTMRNNPFGIAQVLCVSSADALGVMRPT